MYTRKRRTLVADPDEDSVDFANSSSAAESATKRRRTDLIKPTFLDRMNQDVKKRQSVNPYSSNTAVDTSRRISSPPKSPAVRPSPCIPAISCPDCGAKLRTQASYNTHRNVVHGELVRAKIVCPEGTCHAKFATMQTFIPHLNVDHGHNLNYFHKQWKNPADFDFWLENLTADGSVGFVKSSSSSTDGTYYYCKESGKRDDGAAYCPAHFRMTKKGGLVDVYGELQHVGHGITPQYVSLSAKENVSEKMATLEEKFGHLSTMLKSNIPADFPFDSHNLVSGLITNFELADYHITEAIRLVETIIPNSPKKRGRKSNAEQEKMKREINFQQLEESSEVEASLSSDATDDVRLEPVMMSDGRVQCLPCGVTFKSVVSYNAHRNKVHRLAAFNP